MYQAIHVFCVMDQFFSLIGAEPDGKADLMQPQHIQFRFKRRSPRKMVLTVSEIHMLHWVLGKSSSRVLGMAPKYLSGSYIVTHYSVPIISMSYNFLFGLGCRRL